MQRVYFKLGANVSLHSSTAQLAPKLKYALTHRLISRDCLLWV